MAHEEKVEQKIPTKNGKTNNSSEKPKKRESLEERLQRIEAEAANRRKVEQEKVVNASSKPTEIIKKTTPPPAAKVKEEPISKTIEKAPPSPKVEKKKPESDVKKSAKKETTTTTAKKSPPKRRAPRAPKKEIAQANEMKDAKAKEVAAPTQEKSSPKRKPASRSNSKKEAQKTVEATETTANVEKEAVKAKRSSAPKRKIAEAKAEIKKVEAQTEAVEAPASPTKTTKPRSNSRRKVASKKDATPTEKKTQVPAPEKEAEQKPAAKRTSRKSPKKESTEVAKKANEPVAAAPTEAKKTSSRNTKRPAKRTASGNKPAAKKATSSKKTPISRANKNQEKKPAARNNQIVKSAPHADTEKDLYINSTPTQVEIALMENGKLVELHHQKTNNNFTVGDIFLGRIKRLMPGLNAAFVDIGHKKDAFLHYTDLGPKLRSLLNFTDGAIKNNLGSHTLDNFTLAPEIIKTGKIDQVLNKRDSILVQVLKEPIGTKGPRLSCEITIPGRFLVLTPFVDVIAVSKKIGNSEERKRLKMLIESIKPKNFGVIVRTAAEGKKVQDLHEELKIMMDKWESIYSQLHDSQPPMKLLSELDKASSILRDVLNDSFNNIVVNDKELFNNIKVFMGSFAPEQVNIVKLHRSRKPIFDEFSVTKQIKSSFGKTATMNSGAYLVIEHTEAMHVIDVNSGHKMSSSDQEEAVLSVNLESAEEIARQMRLRDIGGIIIVDFIDMRNKDHKLKLVSTMRHFMKKDRAQHTILPLSKFGLMQITRQRVRPEVKINTAEVCPSCNGTGKINPSILLVDALERDLMFILQSRPKSKLVLHVHPYVEAYLKKGIPSIQMKWYMKFYKWIKVRSNADYSMTAYKFFDGNDDEIRLK